jgi:hypothetical protein
MRDVHEAPDQSLQANAKPTPAAKRTLLPTPPILCFVLRCTRSVSNCDFQTGMRKIEDDQRKYRLPCVTSEKLLVPVPRLRRPSATLCHIRHAIKFRRFIQIQKFFH